jgi:hypothetical protein
MEVGNGGYHYERFSGWFAALWGIYFPFTWPETRQSPADFQRGTTLAKLPSYLPTYLPTLVQDVN